LLSVVRAQLLHRPIRTHTPIFLILRLQGPPYDESCRTSCHCCPRQVVTQAVKLIMKNGFEISTRFNVEEPLWVCNLPPGSSRPACDGEAGRCTTCSQTPKPHPSVVRRSRKSVSDSLAVTTVIHFHPACVRFSSS
jgi:hypothetical protein